MLSSSGNRAARTMAKPVKVLLSSSPHRLRIPNELARHLEIAGGGMALVVSPSAKVWRVEVGRDGEGAFLLGRGWPEFAAVHGIGVGWLLVLRHEGGGVLTVKAFDPSCCLQEFGRPLTVAGTRSRIGGARRPQFIKVLVPGFMEKMLIPGEFAERYISEEQLKNSRMALVCIPLGKFCSIELKKDRSGVFFAGGWPQFVALHGFTESDALLLRYEGNMLFTVKAFGPNGCQKEFRELEVKAQQKTESQREVPSSSRKPWRKNESPSAGGEKSDKIRLLAYEIGPHSWMKKEMNSHSHRHRICLPRVFCNSIGFRQNCTITLKASMNSTRSWPVRGFVYRKSDHYLGRGWARFWRENKVKAGDVCTFNVVETTLWHVVITRC